MNTDGRKRVDAAAAHFAGKYLCSQSILMAFAPELGIEPAVAARIGAPFGGGMARMGWTCGAVTGALMVIGLKYGHELPDQETRKENTYGLVRKFLAGFEKRNRTVACRELLGVDISTPEGLEKIDREKMCENVCPKFVRDAAEVLERVLAEAG